MIELYIKEFTAIVQHLLKNSIGILKEKQQVLAVSKQDLLPLLEKNLYEEPAEKLKVWKELNWLITDEGHTTKCLYVKESKTNKRLVVIDLKVYARLINLASKQGG